MTNATLIATIGTRDLMFQTTSGEWFNIGDDQMRDDIVRQNILSEQDQVLTDLKLGTITFLELTDFLLENIKTFGDRLKPVILGKLLDEQAFAIKSVYLIGTNQQRPDVLPQYRAKDTVFACELVEHWLKRHHPHIEAEIIELGIEGTDPSDFEAMFQWWRRVWRSQITIESEQDIWLCLKGGVGQAAEAARISGLSIYGDRIQFFDFTQTPKQNRQGMPSDYRGPLLGTHYLWDRVQQQALQLLGRYDYAGAEALLGAYIRAYRSEFSFVPTALKAGIAWNQGQFNTFVQYAKGQLTGPEQRQTERWWWMAYEQAHLAVIRFEQKNTSEAMLHSFRAIEGAVWEWMQAHISQHINHPPRRYPQLLQSICQSYPSLSDRFRGHASVNLTGYHQEALIQAAIPETARSRDLQSFWSQDTRNYRNALSHKLGGITEKMLFDAWGEGVQDQKTWEKRVLTCLNLITGQSSFRAIAKVSLLTTIHEQLVGAIAALEL